METAEVPRYYKVFVNDKEVAVVVHEAVNNLHLSLGYAKGAYVSASAVCREEGMLVLIDWLWLELSQGDAVRFESTPNNNTVKPIKKYLMQGRDVLPGEQLRCDFCKNKESPERRVLPSTSDVPSICEECVAVANRLLQSSAGQVS